MLRKSFTLMEIMIVLVILSILATLGFPAYQNMINNEKNKVCQANLEALGVALEIYAMEHDTFPGDLSQIPEQYLQKGFAKLMERKDAWKIKLAYYIVGFQQRGLAYAGLLTDLARGNSKLLTCPAAAPAGNSYGIRSSFLNARVEDVYRNVGDSAVFIADCNAATFAGIAGVASTRHKKGAASFGQMIIRSVAESTQGHLFAKSNVYSGACAACLNYVRRYVTIPYCNTNANQCMGKPTDAAKIECCKRASPGYSVYMDNYVKTYPNYNCRAICAGN